VRTLVLALIALAGVALTVGCGDDDDGSGPTTSADPSCEELSSLESYRYTLHLMLDAPAFGDDPSPSPAEPVDSFAEALAAFFADMRLEGAYVAPDRVQVVLTFEGEELEWRSIGDESWVRFEDEWEAEEEAGSDDVLTPRVVCDDIVEDLADSLESADREEDTVNGIEAYYYALGREDITELPDLLGGGSPELPDDVHFDVWLAQDGLWPVKVNIGATDEDEDGQPVALSLEMELMDVGDAGITIDEPEVDGTGGAQD
jgi:hypothetical protein